MSSEEGQRLDQTEPEAPASELPDIDGAPNLIVQSRVDHWKQKWKRREKGGDLLADPGPPPRFGIRHIMAWTFCWGIYVSIVRHFMQGEPDAASLISTAFAGFSTSGAFLGLSLFVVRRLRGRRWAIEPGGWLLIIRAWHFVLSVVRWAFGVSIIPWIMLGLLDCAPHILPLFSKSVSRLWKCQFLLLLAATGGSWAALAFVFSRGWQSGINETPLTYGIQLYLSYSWILIAFQPALFAVVDFRRRAQYTWLHWLGIASNVLVGVAATVWLLKSILG